MAYLSFDAKQVVRSAVVEDQEAPDYNTSSRLSLVLEEEEFMNSELIVEVHDMSGLKTTLGTTSVELTEIFANPNNKYEIMACLDNQSHKVLLELEWNSEEQTMELQSHNSQMRVAPKFKGELYLDLNRL